MCVHVLYIFGWGQVQERRPSHKSEKFICLWKQILYLVPFQPARPQCVPNNHQRANFREEEVQRVQEEILLRHAGRCTALLKDVFSTKCSPQLNTEAGQIKYLGEATLGGQCHVPYMQQMLSGAALWKCGESDPLFSKPFLFFKKLRGISYCQYLPALFVSVNNIQCILISFMFYSVW